MDFAYNLLVIVTQANGFTLSIVRIMKVLCIYKILFTLPPR